MTQPNSSKRGAIGILTTLVMGLVLVMAAVSMVLAGISSRENAFILSQSEKTLISTEGCAEEGLLRLSRDPAYVGGPLAMGDATCLLAIGGGGNTIGVKGASDRITHNLLITIEQAPGFHISEWND
jgi:hypothetical protein